MLDKDTNKINIPLECGCIYSFTDYYTSGIQDTKEEDHLLNKFGIILFSGLNHYSMNQGDIKTWDKIKDMIDITKLCSGHFYSIIYQVVKGTYEYYPKQREYMNEINKSIEDNNNTDNNKE